MAAGTANTKPIYPAKINAPSAKVLTGNTAIDGTGTTVLIATAGADGAIFESMAVLHQGVNVASNLKILKKVGAVYTLVFDQPIPALATYNQNGVANNPILFKFDGSTFARMLLNATDALYLLVGTTIAAGYAVTLEGGDY